MHGILSDFSCNKKPLIFNEFWLVRASLVGPIGTTMLHTHEVTGSSPVLSTKRICVTVAHRTLTPFAGVRIPHPLPKKQIPIRVSAFLLEDWDSNPSKCNCPVDSCCHQFKNWWLPYNLPSANWQSNPSSSSPPP